MALSFAAPSFGETPQEGRLDLGAVPGVVIDHLPASGKVYIGSPSIAIVGEGVYVASHDEFGPASTEHVRAASSVFRSVDSGRSWKKVARLDGQFWSTLFVHDDALFLIGADKHHGNVIIRRSDDRGVSWTDPVDENQGLLAEGQYHCSPQPVVVHRGRVWRAMEDAAGGERWGERYRPLMMSAPIDADLLRRDSWTFSNYVPGDLGWLDGKFAGWLEGNAVVDPQGEVVNLLRVAGNELCGVAAMVRVEDGGRLASFDAQEGFIDFPGGAKKFTIRRDPVSGRYFALANWVQPQYVGRKPSGAIRNTLALTSSSDLRDWRVDRVVLHDNDLKTGYQYADWQFEGEDMIAVVRTAHDDGLGGAHNYHDANLMTFHRIEDFRNSQAAESTEGERWISLFDGGSLDAWKGYQTEGVPPGWEVVDGTLHLASGHVDLVTRQEFADFDLRFQWRVGPGGNSGVIYRCDEKETASYRTGPEYQLIDHEMWELDGHDPTASGALYGLYQPRVDASLPAGEWNDSRIVVQSGRVEHWLNGQLVAQARLGDDDWNARVAGAKFREWDRFGKLPAGRIALQAHNGYGGKFVPAWFREIRVRELPSTADPRVGE